MPLVSILVPVYNVERYLSRCLDSLVAQTYKDIEIIIINDGSTDNSRDIALLYSKRFNNIYVYDYENAGISTTRNRALDKAHGDVIAINDEYERVKQEFIKFRAKFRGFMNTQLQTFDELEKDLTKNYNVAQPIDKYELHEKEAETFTNDEKEEFNVEDLNDDINEVKSFYANN